MWRRDRRDRGSVAIEAALVTPVVMAMIFGIVEFGFFFKSYLSTSSAVKAGVRMASANPRNANYAQDAADHIQSVSGALDPRTVQDLWVYKANTTNDFPEGYSSFSGCTTCVKFRWNGTSFEPLTGTTWNASSQSACSGMGYSPDRVGVYLRVRHDAMTGFVFRTLSISESTVMSLEPIPFMRGCR
jgi:Flp pilus assembly protein TadG